MKFPVATIYIKLIRKPDGSTSTISLAINNVSDKSVVKQWKPLYTEVIKKSNRNLGLTTFPYQVISHSS